MLILVICIQNFNGDRLKAGLCRTCLIDFRLLTLMRHQFHEQATTALVCLSVLVVTFS